MTIMHIYKENIQESKRNQNQVFYIEFMPSNPKILPKYAKSSLLYWGGMVLCNDIMYLKAHIPINPRPQYTLLIHLKRFWEIHIVSQYFIGLGVSCMVLGRPINPNIQGAPLLIYLKGSWEIHILSISLFTIHGSDISCIQSLMHQSPIHQITVVEK